MGGMARYDAYYSSCMIKVKSPEYLTKQVSVNVSRLLEQKLTLLAGRHSVRHYVQQELVDVIF